MLKRLHLQNFTVFADAEFEFGPGLNVLVGTNGTGKTHVLKAGYAIGLKIIDLLKFSIMENYYHTLSPYYKTPFYNTDYMFAIHDKIKNIFLTSAFQQGKSELVRYQSSGDTSISVATMYPGSEQEYECSINLFGKVDAPWPKFTWVKKSDEIKLSTPVFIPAREVLTMNWLLPLYDRREVPIDETYPDLLRLLSGPPLRNPEPVDIVHNLTQLIGGKIEEENNKFYLASANKPRIEMNLVAEGMRKFATLYKLLANGTLTPETTLFWDEPEANLNPALLKEMAAVLSDLAEAGFQVILATHSLFLMRELHILAQQRKKPVRYFGLYTSQEGDVQVEQQDDLMQLQHLVALDAELKQTFDFEAALDDEYAGN